MFVTQWSAVHWKADLLRTVPQRFLNMRATQGLSNTGQPIPNIITDSQYQSLRNTDLKVQIFYAHCFKF